LETARLERADRARWKTDAQSKMSRVNDLMKSLLDNLRDIRSRRGPLQEQLGQWTQRQTQYEGLLTEMNQRKSDMEELLRK
jgi:predicted  nucleic acid-binding Zn-ribbon protein